MRKERAEVLLQTRMQLPNEGGVVFVEQMKRLFWRADSAMAEEKKLRFLMRSVKEELFSGLVRNPPKTVAEFVFEASTIEKALEVRANQYNHPPVGTSNANYVDGTRIPTDTLHETIRAIAKEELQKLFPTVPQPQVALLHNVIRETVQQALGTPTLPELPREAQAMAYTAAVRPPHLPEPRRQEPSYYRSSSSARPPTVQRPTPRKTDVWRTTQFERNYP